MLSKTVLCRWHLCSELYKIFNNENPQQQSWNICVQVAPKRTPISREAAGQNHPAEQAPRARQSSAWLGGKRADSARSFRVGEAGAVCPSRPATSLGLQPSVSTQVCLLGGPEDLG